MNDPINYGWPAQYQIQVRGALQDDWEAWLAGMTLTVDGEVSTFTGWVVDQPALYGFLNRLRDLGLTLISVKRVIDGPAMCHNS